MHTKGKFLSPVFWWLNATQFLGALNDNVFKMLVIFLLVAPAGGRSEAGVISTASFFFVLPVLLFSSGAGCLADRFSKHWVIRWSKVSEFVLMSLAVAAACHPRAAVFYALLFAMCAQSAVFGPAKYGILPEIVDPGQLSRANGILVGSTYLAIILGTFLPSLLAAWLGSDAQGIGIAVFAAIVALTGMLTSFGVGGTRPVGSAKPMRAWFPTHGISVIRYAAGDRYLLLAILAVSYFMFIAAFIQQSVLVFGQSSLGWSIERSGFLFPVSALGIGIGALLAGRLSGRNVEYGIVPIGAVGLAVSCFLMASADGNVTMAFAWLFLTGISSGLFVVPLNAFIQSHCAPERRGEILGCVNLMSFTGVALSAGAFYMCTGWLGMPADWLFFSAGILTAVLAIVAGWVLPDFLVRFAVVVMTRFVYRIRVRGIEHLPMRGAALLVPNHVTWMDALILSATTERRIRFLMARELAENRWLRPLFRLMGVIPVSATDRPRQVVMALESARRCLDEGYLVCIFAEGAITRTGHIHGFRGGMERILRGSQYPIIPIHIGGAWGSLFSYARGQLLHGVPERIPYPVDITIGSPMPTATPVARVRRAVMELSGAYWDAKRTQGRTLGHTFIRCARRWWSRTAVGDSTGRVCSYGQLLVGSLLLRRHLKRPALGQPMIGILLPPSVAGAMANVAVALMGKIAVNLNYTASREIMEHAVRQCEIRTVVSSRRFVEKIGKTPGNATVVWIEDLLAGLGPREKLGGFMEAWLPAGWILRGTAGAGPDADATVIFSSGSTGVPKGVELTHHNILSDIEAFRTVFRFRPADRLCGILPFFHSFGYTVTLWCPILGGCSAWFHPNPLDANGILQLIRTRGLTVLLATPTFLVNFSRKGSREDLRTMRSVIVGAEKLREGVASSFEAVFGVRPLEGYGTTELSPVVAANLPDVDIDGVRQAATCAGSVGIPIPGLATKTVDPATGADLPEGQEGILAVKGPTVMKGYLHQPEATAQVIRDGWYITGDIARVDADGFVHIVGRVARYSKIGGEMVPHMAVEDRILQALKTTEPVVVVTAVPDEHRGEQLVLFHTPSAGSTAEIQELVRHMDLPNLWKPKGENFFQVDEVPTLGSGKLDFRRLQELAKELIRVRPGVVQRVVDRIKDIL